MPLNIPDAGFFKCNISTCKLPSHFKLDQEHTSMIHIFETIGWTRNEAVITLTFKNVIPAVLGAEFDSSKDLCLFPLAAIRVYATWNPKNGIGGVKVRINSGV